MWNLEDRDACSDQKGIVEIRNSMFKQQSTQRSRVKQVFIKEMPWPLDSS
jgi:hypothetical protein